MEDLYSDLENYQHDNIVSELRNENQELKSKLEEYASTLANLQKDFDNLSTEYKKLELNYSSLLKTARAELQRKSQLITNLNIEKDKLVINSFPNRLRVQRKNNNGNKQKTGAQLDKTGNSRKVENNGAVSNSPDQVSLTFNQEWKDKDDKSTFSLGPNVNDDLEGKDKEQKSKKTDQYAHREQKNDTRKSKENYLDAANNKNTIEVVSKIKNRRKSMPLLNRGDLKLSSDEEQDEVNHVHHFRKNSPLRDDRIDYNKYYNGRNYPEKKYSDSSRGGDKYASNYDSFKDVYRISRYREYDRHKSRDRYESNQRSRRHYSPDRPHYKIQGDYNKYKDSNNRPHRSDVIRHRTLVSPPPEKYQHSRHREFETLRTQNEGVRPRKHKIHDALDQPEVKRLRSNSLNKHLHQRQDRDVGGHSSSISKPLELSYLSLQSPDYVNLENTSPILQIKEIKETADSKLDDPRLTNKKYVVTKQRDKVLLSTLVGRDVDIKVIDKSTWSKNKEREKHEMPTLLKEKPQINEDLLKDIYIGIDEPISNLSLESGEICVDEEIGCLSENQGTVNTNRVAVNTVASKNRGFTHNEDITVNTKETCDKIDNMQQTSHTLFSKIYKIPKDKKLNSTKSLDTNNKQDKKQNTKQGHKKKSREKRDLEKEYQSKDKGGPLADNNTCEVDVNKKHKFVHTKGEKSFLEKSVVSAKDTVEGDLELSDETCDYIESIETRYEEQSKIKKFQESNKSAITDGINKNVNTVEVKRTDCVTKEHSLFEHGIEPHCENKHFTISHKAPEVQSKESLGTISNEHKSKDIKSKLCDLFGDTSSLITLGDLGIVAPPTTKELNEYNPLFDNTQDAVDLNIEDMEKVQTRSIKLKQGEYTIKDKCFDVTSEKMEHEINKPTNTEKQKTNDDLKKRTSIQHNIFNNINVDPEDNTVVKTIIISTGVQNNCHSEGDVGNRENKQKLSTTQVQANDNGKGCPGPLIIKALATSTPHKPQIKPSSVPEISCSSNNSATTQNASNINCNTEDPSKMLRRDGDVPDVRIIVKRRRKTKGTPS